LAVIVALKPLGNVGDGTRLIELEGGANANADCSLIIDFLLQPCSEPSSWGQVFEDLIIELDTILNHAKSS
jgi:hypothetical protein